MFTVSLFVFLILKNKKPDDKGLSKPAITPIHNIILLIFSFVPKNNQNKQKSLMRRIYEKCNFFLLLYAHRLHSLEQFDWMYHDTLGGPFLGRITENLYSCLEVSAWEFLPPRLVRYPDGITLHSGTPLLAAFPAYWCTLVLQSQ